MFFTRTSLLQTAANYHLIRTEQYPPWRPESRFARLRSMLTSFQDRLPRNLQYSRRNTDTHIMYKNTLAPYTLMHSIYFLSIITLHRAYLPFLPFRSGELRGGPLLVDDHPPPFLPGDRGILLGDDFWQENMRELFKAARQMIDLASACHGRDVLAENCLVSFALYNAALVGIYAAHMDQEGYKPMQLSLSEDGSNQQQATVRALEILLSLVPRQKMAGLWFRTLNRLNGFFSKAQRDYYSGRQQQQHRNFEAPRSDSSDRQCANGINGYSSGLDSGTGLVEKLFHEFGKPEDQLSSTDTMDTLFTDQGTNISETGSTTARSEIGENRDTFLLPERPGPGPGPGPGQGGIIGRRESWMSVGPNLPPPGRPHQSPPYTLPSLQDGPLFNNTSSSLPSPPPPPPPQPPQYFPGPPARLQSMNSLIPPLYTQSQSQTQTQTQTHGQGPPQLPPPYTQSLPPINIPPSQSSPCSGGGGGNLGINISSSSSHRLSSVSAVSTITGGGGGYGVTSPPATTDSSDNNININSITRDNNNNGNGNGNNINLSNLSSVYFTADDLLVFLNGDGGDGDGVGIDGDESSGGDHFPITNTITQNLTSANEVGIPSGWFSAVWSEFGRW